MLRCGRAFYLDHKTPATTWTRLQPSKSASSILLPTTAHAKITTDPVILVPHTTNVDGTYVDVCLILGWEEWLTLDVRPYFVDHHMRTMI